MTGSPAGPTLRTGELVGEYELVREIGRGAMAAVFEARAKGGKSVALKVLLPEAESDPDLASRFEREGHILQALRHENIARVFEVGSAAGTLYLVIELLEGEDLATLLSTVGPLPVATAVRYVVDACHGLAEAHAQGIVHRDLKPANLFVAKDNRGGRIVKILDFGVAKLLRSVVEHTSGGAVLIGSPHYAAPEQMIDASKVGPPSDIWALGVILYRALSDALPFERTSLAQLAVAIREDTPRPITLFRPDCPPALDAIVRRCLAKKPEERFATAAELARALQPFAEEPTDKGRSIPVIEYEPLTSADQTDVDADGTKMMPDAHALQKQSAMDALALGTSASRSAPSARERRGASARRWKRAPTIASLVVVAALALVGGALLLGARSIGRSPTVRLRIATHPEGAFVSVDLGPQAVAPTEMQLPRESRPHTVMVWKDGYRAEQREVAVREDTVLEVTLSRAP